MNAVVIWYTLAGANRRHNPDMQVDQRFKVHGDKTDSDKPLVAALAAYGFCCENFETSSRCKREEEERAAYTNGNNVIRHANSGLSTGPNSSPTVALLGKLSATYLMGR